MSETNPTNTPSYDTDDYVITGTLDLPQTAPSSEQLLAIQSDGTVVASGVNVSIFSAANISGSFTPTITFLTGTFTWNAFPSGTYPYTQPSETSIPTSGITITSETGTVTTTGDGYPNGPQGIYFTWENYVEFTLEIPIVFNLAGDDASDGNSYNIGFSFELPYLPSGATVTSSLLNLGMPSVSNNLSNIIPAETICLGELIPNFNSEGSTPLQSYLVSPQVSSSGTVLYPVLSVYLKNNGDSASAYFMNCFVINITGRYTFST